jgi:hypothetical protein
MSEIPSSPEEKGAVYDLPSELGFIENEELEAVRRRILEAVTVGDEEKIHELHIEYSYLGVKVVEQKQGDDYPRAQIGFLIAKALVWKEAGRTDYYTSELYDALTDAEGMADAEGQGYAEVATTLREALDELFNETEQGEIKTPSEEISEGLGRLGEELGFDSVTCDEIAVMPFDEAFESAYGYLTQAGLDADEILADFIEKSEENDSLQ